MSKIIDVAKNEIIKQTKDARLPEEEGVVKSESSAFVAGDIDRYEVVNDNLVIDDNTDASEITAARKGDETLPLQDTRVPEANKVPTWDGEKWVGRDYAKKSDAAPLEEGKVPDSLIPAAVDVILEYSSVSAFPEEGDEGSLYLAKDTDTLYRWSGSAYSEVSSTLELGDEEGQAFPGDRGKELFQNHQGMEFRIDRLESAYPSATRMVSLKVTVSYFDGLDIEFLAQKVQIDGQLVDVTSDTVVSIDSYSGGKYLVTFTYGGFTVSRLTGYILEEVPSYLDIVSGAGSGYTVQNLTDEAPVNVNIRGRYILNNTVITITGIGGNFFPDHVESLRIPATVFNILPIYMSPNRASFTAVMPALHSLRVSENNLYLDSRDNCNAIIETSTNTLVAGCTSSTIPSTVQIIGMGAFGGTFKTSIVIPGTVSTIGYSAFAMSSTLQSVEIQNGVTTIAGSAFDHDSALTSVSLPDSITSIGGSAFSYSAITSIILPPSITSLPSACFYGCEQLRTITCRNYVTRIDSGALTGCLSLAQFDFSRVKDCFSCDNVGLRELHLPAVFEGNGGSKVGISYCPYLERISVSSDNPYFDSRDNCNAVIRTSDNTLLLAGPRTVIPDTVIRLGEAAFGRVKSYKPNRVYAPASVRYLENWVFRKSTITRVSFDGRVELRPGAFSASDVLILDLPVNFSSYGSDYSESMLSIIYYAGTVSEYNNLSVDWGINSKIGKIVCSDGEIKLKTGRIVNLSTNISLDMSRSTVICDQCFIAEGTTILLYTMEQEIGKFEINGVDYLPYYLEHGCVQYRVPDGDGYLDIEIYTVQEITSTHFAYDVITDSSTQEKSLLISGAEVDDLPTMNIDPYYRYDGEILPVKYVGGDHFPSRLTTLSLPHTVVEILYAVGSPDFIPFTSGLSWLQNLSIERTNPRYDSRSGCNSIIETATNTVVLACPGTKLPDTVVSCGDAYRKCDWLTELHTPAGLTSPVVIGSTSLRILDYSASTLITEMYGYNPGTPNLERLVLPPNYTPSYNPDFSYYGYYVGEHVYYAHLEEIVIPSGVTQIYGFNDLPALTEVEFPSGMTSINGFNYCGLTHVALPENIVTVVGFDHTNITSVWIPASVVNLNAFHGCDSLVAIEVDPNNTLYDSRNNCNGVIVTADNELNVGCKATIIPSDVPKIGVAAFSDLNVRYYEIPNTVTYISDAAFASSLIEEIVIPSSVTYIGRMAFYNCKNLYKVSTINWNCTILERTFEGCDSLVKVDFLQYPCMTSEGMFMNCKALVEAWLPAWDWHAVRAKCFYGCESLRTVHLQSGDIGREAFFRCKSLDTSSIGIGFNGSIGEEAFLASGLEGQITCNDVPSLSKRAFSNTDITTFITSAKELPEGVFQGCSKLTYVHMTSSGSDTKVIHNCFMGATALQSLSIDNGAGGVQITKVGAFKDNKRLASIGFSGTKDEWTALEQNFVSGWREQSNIVRISCSDGAYVYEQKSLLRINANCDKRKIVVIGSTVGRVNDNELMALDTYRITVELSQGEKLHTLTINSVEVTSRITQDGYVDITVDGSFDFTLDAVVRGQLPEWLTSSAWDSGIQVTRSWQGETPTRSIVIEQAYVVNDQIKEVKSITANVTRNMDTIDEITLPSWGDKLLGQYQFSGCHALTTVRLPSNLQKLEAYLFESCRALEYVSIPDSVTEICDSAFLGCSNLITVQIPSGVHFDPNSVCIFNGCARLVTVDLSPVDFTTYSVLGSAMFKDSGIRYIVIPEGVTEIRNWIFKDCVNLRSVSLPATLSSIGEKAFDGVELKDGVLDYSGTTSQWSTIALDANWVTGSNITIVRCSDGDVTL